MPYVFITSYIPYHKTTEAAKKYIAEIKDSRSAARDLIKEIVPIAVKARKDYLEAISINDVKEGKLDEYLKLQQKFMASYHDIEGYKYTIEVWFKITEVLEMIGMKAPE